MASPHSSPASSTPRCSKRLRQDSGTMPTASHEAPRGSSRRPDRSTARQGEPQRSNPRRRTRQEFEPDQAEAGPSAQPQSSPTVSTLRHRRPPQTDPNMLNIDIIPNGNFTARLTDAARDTPKRRRTAPVNVPNCVTTPNRTANNTRTDTGPADPNPNHDHCEDHVY